MASSKDVFTTPPPPSKEKKPGQLTQKQIEQYFREVRYRLEILVEKGARHREHLKRSTVEGKAQPGEAPVVKFPHWYLHSITNILIKK